MIYLCRHGETVFNREGRLQGRLESDLTRRGRRQAAAMADLLSTLIEFTPTEPWRIITSPLRRTRATADIIATKLALPVEVDERLIEVCVGDWEGLLRRDVARTHPTLFHGREKYFRAPGGETYPQVMNRIKDWLAQQVDEGARRLIVVSHGVAGRLLRGAYAGLTRQAILEQDVPQDAIYRLSQGRIERIDCAPVD